MGNSLGFIEVVGMLGAIEACDVAVKAANVELIGCELTKGGGWVTITLQGDVAAVKAAVDAAVTSVERITKVVSHTVIARPSKELEKITKDNTEQPETKKIEENKEIENKNDEITIEKLPAEDKKVVETKASPTKPSESEAPVVETKTEDKTETTKAPPEPAKATGTTGRTRTATKGTKK
jgi:microcompartment protein CcmL/EutN